MNRKNRRIDEKIMKAAVKDYECGALTVKQIAAKYGIGVRTIYVHVSKAARRRKTHKMGSLRLSRAEIEVLLLLILEQGEQLSGEMAYILPTLEEKLLEVADRTCW